MNHRLLIRVTAPAVAVGVLLFAACLASIVAIDQLQSDLTHILTQNVTSLQAAQELEICVRQVRYRTMQHLLDPKPERLPPIEGAHHRFEAALEIAQLHTNTPEERVHVLAIETGYQRYRQEQKRLHSQPPPSRMADVAKLADSHPVQLVIEPCQELLRHNKEKMDETARAARRVARQGRVAMLVLGIAGPVGGLILGFGVARALRRSIYRLSVRVQDAAQRLDQKVASVSVAADGDIQTLDRQMQHITDKIEEVAAHLREQQRELMRAEQLSTMGQLAAGVAHEVRNPLTAIKMLVEAALRGQKPRPLSAEDLRIIHGEVTRLERTVQDFLTFTRLPTAEPTLCDLRAVIDQARELVQVRARQQQVEIVVQVPGEPVLVNVDRGQFGTVLVNLFLNALDAMPTGGRLTVALTAAAGAVKIEVSDNGSGIPPAIIERLFTPFATTKPEGTGLGLSLSARILEEHGGSVSAHNRPEGGAAFLITLPVPSAEVRRHADAAGNR